MVRVGVLLSACLLVGCGRENEPVLIGVIPRAANDEFSRRLHAGAVKGAREFALTIDWSVPRPAVTADQQIAVFDEMLKRKAAGIVVAPVNAAAIAPAVERATRAGIPVAILDSSTRIAGGAIHVSTDNREAGRMAAQFMGQLLLGEGPVMAIACGTEEGEIRAAAFREEMNRMHPGLRVPPATTLDACTTDAAESANEFLDKHPQLRGLLAADQSSSTAVVAALKAHANTRVRTVVFDASDERIQDLRDRVIAALITEQPFQMGYAAARAIGMKLRGQSPPASINSGVKLVTRLNLETPEIVEVLRPDVHTWLAGADGR